MTLNVTCHVHTVYMGALLAVNPQLKGFISENKVAINNNATNATNCLVNETSQISLYAHRTFLKLVILSNTIPVQFRSWYMRIFGIVCLKKVI